MVNFRLTWGFENQYSYSIQYKAVACPGIRKGGRKSERPLLLFYFFAFQSFKGGPSLENRRENNISD